jgi:hypothetical protein
MISKRITTRRILTDGRRIQQRQKKIGKNVAATTFGFVDKMIDFVGSVVDTGTFNIFGSLNVVEKSFEAAAKDGMTLEVEGVNGQFFVRSTRKKRSLSSPIFSSRNIPGNADSIIAYSDTGDAVTLKTQQNFQPECIPREFLSLQQALEKSNLKPQTARFILRIQIRLSLSASPKMQLSTLWALNSDKVTANTRNAKITLSYVAGRDFDINTNKLTD